MNIFRDRLIKARLLSVLACFGVWYFWRHGSPDAREGIIVLLTLVVTILVDGLLLIASEFAKLEQTIKRLEEQLPQANDR
jgi:hypothetical protein